MDAFPRALQEWTYRNFGIDVNKNVSVRGPKLPDQTPKLLGAIMG
jgi:hypothetical protein